MTHLPMVSFASLWFVQSYALGRKDFSPQIDPSTIAKTSYGAGTDHTDERDLFPWGISPPRERYRPPAGRSSRLQSLTGWSGYAASAWSLLACCPPSRAKKIPSSLVFLPLASLVSWRFVQSFSSLSAKFAKDQKDSRL